MHYKLFLLFTLFLFSGCSSKNLTTYKINDTRTYEVKSALLSEDAIISVWMEARPNRISKSEIDETRIGYKFSKNGGKSWSKKKIIDDSSRLLLGNPYLINHNENLFLVFMNVNKNFFSGNIAFYKWDNKSEEFQLRSIPVESSNTLIDKPSLSIINNDIVLTYIEYNQTLDEGKIYYQISKDNGVNWSDKQDLTNDDTIYLGVSSASANNIFNLAYGTFWDGQIYFKSINTKFQNEFENVPHQVIAPISDTLVSALTEIEMNHNGDIAVGWFYQHQPNEVYIMIGTNEGKSWNQSIRLSSHGNLLAFDFDHSNNLICMYSEYKNDFFSVYTTKIDLDDPTKITNKNFLKEPTKINKPKDYIGAFQDIIITENNKVYTFWIDYSNNSQLNISTWKE